MSNNPTAEVKLSSFLESLSSDSPSPGGGSAASLVGSIAASLLAMSFKVSGKSGGEGEFGSDIQDLENSRDQLLKMVDEDAKAFSEVISAYRLHRDKSDRDDNIQDALKNASTVPYSIAEVCLRIIKHGEKAAGEGEKSVITDVGAGCYLGEAALQSALFNVRVNLNSISDSTFCEKYLQKSHKLSKKGVEVKERISSIVNSKL